MWLNWILIIFPGTMKKSKEGQQQQLQFSRSQTSAKKSPDNSVASSPDITTRSSSGGNTMALVNGGSNPIGLTMSEASDDSSLNSVDLDPIGKKFDENYVSIS